MNIRVGRRVAAVLAMATAMLWVHGARANNYDESLLHDLSNNGLVPTDFVLGYSSANSATVPAGSNFLIGTTGAAASIDRDYVHLVIPEHYALVALRVEPTTTVFGSYSFVGIAAGKKISTLPTANTAAGLLGWKLYSAGENAKAVDILADMRDIGLNQPLSVSKGAVWNPPKPCPLPGKKTCLAAGDYTLWIQENSRSLVHYKFDLILAPVPDAPPVALWLAGLGVVGGVGRRWKKPRV
jgi:hypothetical protein